MKNINFSYNNIKFKSINEKEKNQIDTSISKEPFFQILKDKKKLKHTLKVVKNYSNNKNHFIIFGIGGSNLGSKALIDILQKNNKKKITFFDNIDPIYFKNSINNYKFKDTGFIIISKSGKTLETLSQFACIIEIFKQKNKLKNFYKNCLVITEDTSNPLRKIATNNNCLILNHEKDIGGRYSVFSNVGTVPALIAGIDVIKFHEGASDIVNKVANNKDFQDHQNIANLLTIPSFLNKIKINVIMTYSDRLNNFGKWYLQLWAESIGKKGKGITSIHSIGATDQHSQIQLYLDGPKDKFFNFITTNHQKKGLKINKEVMIDKVPYLAGKYMGDLMAAEQKATINTFIKNKFMVREINLPEINEFTIGQLMALSIFETIIACKNLGVNPFDQPAVEEGKLLTKKYLS